MIDFDRRLTAWLYIVGQQADVAEDDLVERHPLGRQLYLHRGEPISLTTPSEKVILTLDGEDEEDGETVAWNYSSADGEWYLKIVKN